MLLEKLSNVRGVSGDEAAVRELIIEAIVARVDEYRVDTMGNLISYKRASARQRPRGFQVLLAAHMDEVGLVITHVDRDGRLRFSKVGGIDNRVLPGQLFHIGGARTPGVIGIKPWHLTKSADREKVIDADELTIDIGARSQLESLQVVQPGDYATFASEFTRIGDGLIRGKALDDRAGCALLVELLGDDYPFDVYGVFTVQEEIGLRGARVAASAVNPQVAFVLESTVCDDSPKEKDLSPTTRLGFGPALTLADGGFIANSRLTKLLSRTAEQHRIPFQYKQPLIGGTDAGRLHLTRGGVPSAVLSIPTRYLHTPAAILSLRDYENGLTLMRRALPQVHPGMFKDGRV